MAISKARIWPKPNPQIQDLRILDLRGLERQKLPLRVEIRDQIGIDPILLSRDLGYPVWGLAPANWGSFQF